MKAKILIAGHEIGGQMQLLAETLRKKGYNARSAAFNSDFRHYHNDIRIASQKIPFQRFIFFLKAIFQFDVFHFFWGVSLFDFWKFTGLDLPLLKLMNKKIIVHFRGTDLVDIHYYNYLQAKTRGENVPEPPKSRPDQLARLAQWRKYADHLLVSTPDLLEIVPEAILIPQVVDVHEFQQWSQPVHNTIFRLGHAPSRRSTKGTEFIIAAVKNLQDKGHKIELDLIENELPDHVMKRFSVCDAGIDQLLLGWYGKVSVELMAMGKPVLCYMDEKWTKKLPDLPIINVNKNNIEEQLLMLLQRKQEDSELSRIFVLQHHNVDTIADQLVQLYKSKSNATHH